MPHKQFDENIHTKKDKPYAIKSSDTGVIIKDVDTTKRIVTGLYNTALYFDSDQDVLLKGCADRSIKERGPASTSTAKIKHLMFHDWTQLPGKIQVLEEKTVEVEGKNVTGIYFETKMADTQLGTDTIINYQEQVYDNHSIGFRYLDGEWVDAEASDWQKYLDLLINPEDAIAAGYMFVWKEIKLYEGSTVAFGANELTPYLGVKSGNKEAMIMKLSSRINALKTQVISGKQSDEMLQSFEMQLMQLDQIIKEVFVAEPSIKSILQDRSHKDIETQKAAEKDAIDHAIKNTKFFHN